MDEELHGPRQTARWLAWATAGLLVAGAVSAGTVASRDEGAGQRIVAAAGTGADGVEAPPPVTAPSAPPVVPSTTVPPPTTSTSAVKSPVAKPPVTSTAPLRPSTTMAPVRATTPTTAKSAAGVATVTVVNQAADAFVITVNGRTFQLAPGQSVGPVQLELYAHGNDIVEVHAVADPTCGLGDADNYFDAGGTYRLAIVPSQGMCQTMPGPQLKVTPA